MKKILNKKLYDFFKNNGLTEIKYPVTKFDANFQYPSTRSGYQYCFSVSDGNQPYIILNFKNNI